MMAGQRKTKPPWRRRVSDAIFYYLLAPPVAMLARLLCATLRIEVDREAMERLVSSSDPVLAVFWHEDLFGILAAHLAFNRGGAAVMISRSRDGEKLARVIEMLRLKPIRASSSRGGARGVLEMLKYLKEHQATTTFGGIALDGPRGPRRQAKPGIALLAKKSEAALQPIAFSYDRAWRFKSWDRTRLPKPFARMTVRLGDDVCRRTETTSNEENLALIQKEMDRLYEQE